MGEPDFSLITRSGSISSRKSISALDVGVDDEDNHSNKLYVEPQKYQGRDGPFVLNWPVGSSHDVLCLFSAVPKAMQLPPNPQFTRRDSES